MTQDDCRLPTIPFLDIFERCYGEQLQELSTDNLLAFQAITSLVLYYWNIGWGYFGTIEGLLDLSFRPIDFDDSGFDDQSDFERLSWSMFNEMLNYRTQSEFGEVCVRLTLLSLSLSTFISRRIAQYPS
ncbi:MAG: hypothetical protein F6K41_24020 [Symploca sp. SIO3E6]|nr:hypothetical protein [Caldora sp. SIO3E6]